MIQKRHEVGEKGFFFVLFFGGLKEKCVKVSVCFSLSSCETGAGNGI